MADSGGFDPYYMWLGIGADEQPASYYRLLDVKTFESNPEVIDTGYHRRMSYLKSIKSGARLEHAERIKNELAEARRCLLHKEKKAAYDADLKRRTVGPAPPLTALLMPPAIPAPPPIIAPRSATLASSADGAPSASSPTYFPASIPEVPPATTYVAYVVPPDELEPTADGAPSSPLPETGLLRSEWLRPWWRPVGIALVAFAYIGGGYSLYRVLTGGPAKRVVEQEESTQPTEVRRRSAARPTASATRTPREPTGGSNRIPPAIASSTPSSQPPTALASSTPISVLPLPSALATATANVRPSIVTGPARNHLLRFDATKSPFTSGTMRSLTYDGRAPLTLEFWYSRTSGLADRNPATYLCGARYVVDAASGGKPYFAFRLRREADGSSSLLGVDHTTQDDVGEMSIVKSWFATPVRLRGRHHLCMTLNPVADGKLDLAVFVDGARIEQFVIAPLADVRATFLIGGAGFNGEIDELRISKIVRHRQQFVPPDRYEPDAETSALLHFDEDSGPLLLDSSGHGHHVPFSRFVMLRIPASPEGVPDPEPAATKAAPSPRDESSD